MNTLKDYVNWKLTHADKVAEAEGYPLVMENCKKNKRMKQLEIYGNSVQDGTPTPENPIEVQSVGEKTVNLFDADLWLPYFDKLDDGSYKVKTGGVHNNNTIPFVVKAGTYTITLDIKCWNNAFYRPIIVDKDGNKYQKYIGNNDENWHTLKLTFTTEVETSHIMWDYNTPNNTLCFRNFQIQEGSTATSCEPFGKYKASIVQRGINLFSMGMVNATAKTINGITFTPLDDERIHIKGKAIDTSVYTQCAFAGVNKPLIKGGVYNVKPYTGLQFIIFEVLKYSTNEFLMNLNSSSYNANLSQDGYMSRLLIRIPAGDTKEWDDIVPIQLTQGRDTKSLPYEPYVEPIKTNVFLNEPLRKIGDYADYIDGKGSKVVRKCIKKYLKDYAWGSYSSAPTDQGTHYELSHKDYSILPYVGNGGASVSKGFSNLLRCIDSSDFASAANAIFMHEWGNNIRVTLSKDYVPNGTVADFKAWFNENNPYMIRILADPTEESITLDLPKLNAKTTVIEVDTSLAPSNAKGKYIKK